MSCTTCEDKGLVAVPWTDAPDDYAVCLCPIGRGLRTTKNYKSAVAPLWEVWAAREQVDPSRVRMLETLLSEDELKARGFSLGVPSRVDREAALLAAGKSRAAKL